MYGTYKGGTGGGVNEAGQAYKDAAQRQYQNQGGGGGGRMGSMSGRRGGSSSFSGGGSSSGIGQQRGVMRNMYGRFGPPPSQGGGSRNAGGYPAPGPAPGAPQMPYQPEDNPAAQSAQRMQGIGQDFMDPNSAFTQKMRDRMARDIGARSEAQQRMASARAARAGFGSGASGALLDVQGEIGREGQRQYGEASADMALAAPGMALNFMNPALGAQTSLQGQAGQMFMGQQNLAQRNSEAQLGANMQAQRLENELMLRELAMLYGG